MDKAAMRDAELADIARDIGECRACPRLVEWRERVAREKVKRFAGDSYWGRPVPGFGDPRARILLVGLAPGAHGANRTGRMFTGDASGAFLYPALHRAGLASAAESSSRDDGLELRGIFISAAARCVPPDNAPSRAELECCRPFLAREWAALSELRVVLCLGAVAHDAAWRVLGEKPVPRFAHGAEHRTAWGLTLIDSYHVSQQNTRTGRLTSAMFDAVLSRAQRLAEK